MSDGLRLDGRCAGHIVEQGQLTEAAAIVIRVDVRVANIGPVLAALDHIEVVAVVALTDNVLVRDRLLLEHGIQHLVHLLLLQRPEQQNILHRIDQARSLLVSLGEYDGGGALIVVRIVLRVVCLGKHGFAANREPGHQRLCN